MQTANSHCIIEYKQVLMLKSTTVLTCGLCIASNFHLQYVQRGPKVWLKINGVLHIVTGEGGRSVVKTSSKYHYYLKKVIQYLTAVRLCVIHK